MNKRLQERIEKRNKAFNNASAEEKRVLIAKDVLKQVGKGRIVPTSGSWVYIPDTFVAEDASFQEEFLKESKSDIKTCECCALGSMVVSCTLFKNDASIDDVEDGASPGGKVFNKNLKPFFSKYQLKLIEIAFETGYGYYTPMTDTEFAAERFGHKFKEDDKRLIAIMKNIIKNKGTFIPN